MWSQAGELPLRSHRWRPARSDGPPSPRFDGARTIVSATLSLELLHGDVYVTPLNNGKRAPKRVDGEEARRWLSLRRCSWGCGRGTFREAAVVVPRATAVGPQEWRRKFDPGAAVEVGSRWHSVGGWTPGARRRRRLDPRSAASEVGF
jgi:hypothetical protein